MLNLLLRYRLKTIEMNLTVDFVSRNLVTHENFVEFRDSQNFTFFENVG